MSQTTKLDQGICPLCDTRIAEQSSLNKGIALRAHLPECPEERDSE